MVRRGIVAGVPGVQGAGVVAARDVRLVAVVGLATGLPHLLLELLAEWQHRH